MIIDTDVGYDDLLAILYLLATGAPISAFTVVNGICDVRDGANVLLRMQEKLGLQEMIPVYMGAQNTQPNAFPPAWRNQANNLKWGDPTHLPQPQPAATFLTQQLRRRPPTVLAIGPQTNIAPAVENPRAGQLTVTAMCGAFNVPGNLPENCPVAEANLYVDPRSAEAVLGWYHEQSSWGRAVTVVPLDACEKVPVNAAFLAAFHGAMGPGKAAALVWQILQQINQEFLSKNINYYAYDPLAAVITQEPAIITQSSMSTIAIASQGQSAVRSTNGHTTIVYNVDRQAFQATFNGAFRGASL